MELVSWLFALGLISKLMYCSQVSGSSCPSDDETSSCSCYIFEEGLNIECDQGTPFEVKDYLSNIKYPIESVNINNLDANFIEFPANILQGLVIKYLHISNSELSSFHEDSLSGQENSIQTLSVLNSKLAEVPGESIKSLKRLEVLDLSYNYISDIPSYSFYGSSIKKLNLQNNILDLLLEYSFAGLDHSLIELSISNNRLKEFPLVAFRRLRHLQVLTITWNFIESLKSDRHTKLIKLKKLDIGYNKIEKIQDDIFSSMPGLQSLSLSTNKIRTIDVNAFLSLVDLEFLDLRQNNIISLEELTFLPLQNIRTIDLSSNHLHSIENIFQNLTNLTELFVAGNNIRHISNDTFVNSTKIATLHLQDNAIETLDVSVFSGLVEIFQIQLSNNFISEISTQLFKNNLKLEMLSLDENNLENIHKGTFENMQNLKELRLQENDIKFIQKGTFQSVIQLQELHLQNNKIEVIEDEALGGLSNLRHLNLKKNSLTAFGKILNRRTSNLQYLQLDGNSIRKVHGDSLQGIDAVEVLRLNDNAIYMVSRKIFRSTKRLQHLYLNRNVIRKIEDGAFSELKDLWHLSLRDNKIRKITKGTFAGLSSLRELHLSNNNIVEIGPESFKFLSRSLEVVSISSEYELSLRSDNLPGQSVVEMKIENSENSQIKSKAFEKMRKLERLIINKAKSVNVDNSLLNLPNLRSLNIFHANLIFDRFLNTDQNQIIDLHIENCSLSMLREDMMNTMKSLQKLSLQFNHLSKLPTHSMKKLEFLEDLNLEANNFVEMPYMSFTPRLKALNIAYNNFSSLEENSFGSEELQITALNISGNKIKVINNYVFESVKHLEVIDLSHNAIQQIAVDAFISLKNLTKLLLNYNRLIYIPSALFNPSLIRLMSIEVHSNPVKVIRKDMGVFRELISLKNLVISKTNLSVLTSHDFSGLAELQNLVLSGNKVYRISPGAFGPLTLLQKLDLSNNLLEIVPSERLSSLSNLISLNLSRNQLKRLDKFDKNHQQLVELDISHNELQNFESWNFSPLVQLKVLIAHNNNISFIHEKTFQNITNLKELIISHNQLTHLSGGFLVAVESSLEVLGVVGNPFDCDCSFSLTWTWIWNHRKILGQQPILCDKPEQMSGQNLWLHNFEYLCAPPLISELEIQPLRYDQMTVQWRVRNQSEVHGVKVLYHSSSQQAQLSSGVLKPPKTQYNIQHLRPATWYTVCIIAMANRTPKNKKIGFHKGKASNAGINYDNNEKCIKIKTPEKSLATNMNWTSLAIILGCIVAVVLVLGVSITFTVLKFYRIRQNRKRTPPKNDVPQEYLSYRHFSLQSIERMFEET